MGWTKGVPRPSEQRARISRGMTLARANESPEIKLRRKELASSRTQSAATRSKLSALHLGMKHTEEAKAKMSAARKGRRVLSDEHYARLSLKLKGHSAHFPKKRFYHKGVPFRSSWEVRVAKALDAFGIRWEYEKTRFDLGSQTYAPDFYLPDGECYWEVKGYYGPKSQRTMALFREQYPDVRLILVRQKDMEALERAAIGKAA